MSNHLKLYLVKSKNECTRLEYMRKKGHGMVSSNDMQSLSWIGHQVQKVKVWMWIWYCFNQKVRWVIISNSLGRSPNARSIDLIPSMIGQAQVIMICKWNMSHIKSITYINTKDIKHTHKKEKNTYSWEKNRITKWINEYIMCAM